MFDEESKGSEERKKNEELRTAIQRSERDSMSLQEQIQQLKQQNQDDGNTLILMRKDKRDAVNSFEFKIEDL